MHKGLGVKAVIARSFAFIYSRNQPGLGLLGIEIRDDAFYDAAADDALITIDIPARTIRVGQGSEVKEFNFKMAEMEKKLLEYGGICTAYKSFKNELWKHMVAEVPQEDEGKKSLSAMVDSTMEKRGKVVDLKLQW